MSQAGPITVLLDRLKGGDRSALEELVPLVYPELRQMAASYLRTERKDHTLQPTALVHEVYLRLAAAGTPGFPSRAHFYGMASQIMRQILVDSARRKNSVKRSLPGTRVTLTDSLNALGSDAHLVVRVDDALETLAGLNTLQARLIEMRFFGGLTAEESAEALDLPVQTVRRQLRVAQAWLHRELATA